MSTKTRKKTYGRKRGNNDLVAAFESLRISPPVEKPRPPCRTKEERAALKERSHNESTRRQWPCSSEQGSPEKFVSPSHHNNPEGDCSDTENDGPMAVRKQPCGRKPKPNDHQSTELPSQPAQNLTSRRSPQPPPSPQLPADLTPLLTLPTTDEAIYSLSDLYDTISDLFSIQKISQGSYASIYRLALLFQPDAYTIWKLIPLRPSSGKGSRVKSCTSYADAVSEIKLLCALSAMPGFVEMRSMHLVQGAMPPALQEVDSAWWNTLDEKGWEDTGEPHGEHAWPDSQWWCFIEMSDAGGDLECLLKTRKQSNEGKGKLEAKEAWDIFWGIVEALAHGEETVAFEHRDLHPGNVCIREQKPAKGKDGPAGEDGEARTGSLVQHYTSLEVTLIDYTLSRAELPVTGSTSASPHKTLRQSTIIPQQEIETLANGMRDPGLFDQHSEDPTDEAQYDTYRAMRDYMHASHTTKERRNGWQSYMPQTNLLWLHHLLAILLRATDVFDQGWSIVEKVEANEEALLLIRLNEVRQLLEPHGDRKWDIGSAAQLLAWFLFEGGGSMKSEEQEGSAEESADDC